MKCLQLAIDGPAGAGKSSVSKLVAERLKLSHVDTGAMYRAVTLEALKRGINLSNEDDFSFVKDIQIDQKNERIYLNNTDVSTEIRSKKVTLNVSLVARHRIVRESMVLIQREIASKSSIVMDGRDIGYHVLPNADLKIYLNASIQKRAERRRLEILEKGHDVDLELIIKEIEERDMKDSNRELNPLRKADDAIEVDTTDLTIEQTVDEIVLLARKRGF